MTTTLHLTDEQIAALDDAAHVAGILAGLDVELTLQAPSDVATGGCVGFGLAGGFVDTPFLPKFVAALHSRADILGDTVLEALTEGDAQVSVVECLDDKEGPFPFLLSWPSITAGSPADGR